jgi:hypothetical protein
MMKANELRVDNWVCHNGNNCQIQTIDQNGECLFIGIVAAPDDGYWFRVGDGKGLEPIPLTPEILEKCGFQKHEVNEGIYLALWLGILREVEQNVWRIDRLDFPGRDARYLHQLQNLYFALIGTELEVSL